MNDIANYVALGKRIRQMRKALSLTQGELASRADIAMSFLGHIERGESRSSIETLLRIATTLCTTPDVLLRDSINQKSNEAILWEMRDVLEQVHNLIKDYLESNNLTLF